MSKSFTLDEVAAHNSKTDLWIVIEGNVYDVTKFKDHPGNFSVFLENAGQDASIEFNGAGHSEEARAQMKDYLIGTVDGAASSGPKKITSDELIKHCTDDDCWLLIHGKIYDVSKFKHPGGKQILVDHSGRDTTQEFDDIQHSKKADEEMEKMFIGDYDHPAGTNGWDDIVRKNQAAQEASGSGFDKLFMVGILVVIFGIFYQFVL